MSALEDVFKHLHHVLAILGLQYLPLDMLALELFFFSILMKVSLSSYFWELICSAFSSQLGDI